MRSHRAMGLVEVLASLFLLGGAATSILVAQGMALEQVRNAALELEASELAHELIATWQLEGAKMTDPASGRFDREGWSWRRQSIKEEILPDLVAPQVVLEIVHEQERTLWVRQFAWLEKSNGSGS